MDCVYNSMQAADLQIGNKRMTNDIDAKNVNSSLFVRLQSVLDEL